MASVLDCLHYGKENAVTREYLHQATDLEDRDIRKTIEHLKKQGHPIFNSADGSGYYLATPEDKADMKRSVRIKQAHAISCMRNAEREQRLMDRVLNPDGLQLSL